MSERFDAIILDPEVSARMLLKQATLSVSQFGEVSHYGTPKEAVGHLLTKVRCDIFFISHRIAEDDANTFMQSAKETAQGRDAAFVLMLGANDQNSATLAKNVIAGLDGFLFEPYSVDSLLEITKLAAKVHNERSSAREAAALALLIQQIIPQLDLLAELRKAGMEAGITGRTLRETCSVLAQLENESFAVYVDTAVRLFGMAPISKPKVLRQYAGPSKRLQRKMEQKLVEDLNKAKKTA